MNDNFPSWKLNFSTGKSDEQYPTPVDLFKAVEEYVAIKCNGEWPEDDWCEYSEYWEMNIWTGVDGQPMITAYLVDNHIAGIRIPVFR